MPSPNAAIVVFAIGITLAAAPIRADSAAAGAVDDARLRRAAEVATDWGAHGRTWAEQRYSPLVALNDANVGGLQVAWRYDTGTERGLEATPLVVDGVMYTTTTWSVVHALDARTGESLWRFDPEVPREVGQKACCF